MLNLFRFSIILCFFFCQQLNAQKITKIELRSADKLKYLKNYKGGAQRLLGNVQFFHEGTTLNCDSAYLYENNTLEAYSHILIRKGDSLSIVGDNLKYDGNTKIAQLTGNVICIEKDMTLTTSVLTYDVGNSVASYYNGGTIVNKNNTLTSTNGYYYSASKSICFKYKVKLVNPEYVMLSDTLCYNTVSRVATFLGPTTITSKQNKLYCEYGWYDTQNEISRLKHNAVITTDKNILKGDSIYYDRKKGYGKAKGNVTIIDTTQKLTITGDFAEHYELVGKSVVTGHTLYAQQLRKDTLFLTADTLYSINKKDSTFLRAYHNIKIYSKDLQGIADSLTYNTSDSIMVLHKMPVLWNGENQLSAKKINVLLGNKSVKQIELKNNAFVISKAAEGYYSQLKGQEINGFFKNDTINFIEILSNAQASYYMKDKKRITALNKITCESIRIFLVKNEISKVTFIKQPKAEIIPIKDVVPSEHVLKGFVNHESKRPQSKLDLINKSQ